MHLLFIGYGSIAKRHISNLFELFKDVRIDVLRTVLKNNHTSNNPNLCFFSDENQLQNRYDAIFITTPTVTHYKTLLQHHFRSNNFFIEKPVFEDDNKDLSFLSNNKNYYVACPLRYSNVIKYLRNNIDFSNVFSIRCISSSYLPDWRSNCDYRELYSAKKELGGGVSIDLIHEWDYLCYLIGFPTQVKSIISKKSDLEITSDDIAVYIADFNKIIAEIHLDYFGRCPIRNIELFCREDTICADLINQKIEWMNSGKKVEFTSERNEYQKKELLHFFEICRGECANDSTIETACKVLKIAKGR